MRIVIGVLKTILWLLGWLWASILWSFKGQTVFVDCEDRFIEFSDVEERLTTNWPTRRYAHFFIREEIANSSLSDTPYVMTHYLGRFKTPGAVIKRIKQFEVQFDHTKVTESEASLYKIPIRTWRGVIIV